MIQKSTSKMDALHVHSIGSGLNLDHIEPLPGLAPLVGWGQVSPGNRTAIWIGYDFAVVKSFAEV